MKVYMTSRMVAQKLGMRPASLNALLWNYEDYPEPVGVAGDGAKAHRLWDQNQMPEWRAWRKLHNKRGRPRKS